MHQLLMTFIKKNKQNMLGLRKRLRNVIALYLPAIFAICVCLHQTHAHAQTFTGNINVRIVDTVSIVENQQVNFGVLLNETGTCVMDATGNTTGDIFSCTGNETTGLFTVTGSSNTSILLSVTPGTANDITFTPTLPNGTSLALTGAGATSSASVLVAGTLSVGPGAPNGVTQVPYTLTANYN